MTIKERRVIKSYKDGFTMLIRDLIGLNNFDLTDHSEKNFQKLLKTLSAKEETVIKNRYGLMFGKSLTLKKIAEQFNCSHEQIRQIEARALRKLRYPLRLRFILRIIRKQLPQEIEPNLNIAS